MKYCIKALLALGLVGAAATPSLADGIPKFASTCVGNSGQSSKICLSSNGKTVSSSYIFRGEIPTKGSHTGCSLSGSSIRCTGGQYRTGRGNGAMSPVVVTLKNGKPSAIAWR